MLKELDDFPCSVVSKVLPCYQELIFGGTKNKMAAPGQQTPPFPAPQGKFITNGSLEYILNGLGFLFTVNTITHSVVKICSYRYSTNKHG